VRDRDHADRAAFGNIRCDGRYAGGEVHVFAMYSPSGERGPHFHAEIEANQAARTPAAQSFRSTGPGRRAADPGLSGPDSPGRGVQRRGVPGLVSQPRATATV
jgi:hypothetical protein